MNRGFDFCFLLLCLLFVCLFVYVCLFVFFGGGQNINGYILSVNGGHLNYEMFWESTFVVGEGVLIDFPVVHKQE